MFSGNSNPLLATSLFFSSRAESRLWQRGCSSLGGCKASCLRSSVAEGLWFGFLSRAASSSLLMPLLQSAAMSSSGGACLCIYQNNTRGSFSRSVNWKCGVKRGRAFFKRIFCIIKVTALGTSSPWLIVWMAATPLLYDMRKLETKPAWELNGKPETCSEFNQRFASLIWSGGQLRSWVGDPVLVPKGSMDWYDRAMAFIQLEQTFLNGIASVNTSCQHSEHSHLQRKSHALLWTGVIASDAETVARFVLYCFLFGSFTKTIVLDFTTAFYSPATPILFLYPCACAHVSTTHASYNMDAKPQMCMLKYSKTLIENE